tara:strand:- start:9560 stop:10387 length:828 start_codon:yes stop_codon:yes gene_type:complete
MKETSTIVKYMRTFMLFLFAAVALIGCEDIQTNNPAMQASLNDELYRAIDARAEINPNGSVVIQGITDLETLTLTLSGSSEGVYTLGGEGTNRAVFEDFLGSVYTTRPFGDGEIIIENSSDNTLTGRFSFNAYRFGLDTLNARGGVFYRVPIIAGSTEEPILSDNDLTAVVDGENFTAAQIVVLNEFGEIVINAASLNGTAIALEFPDTITEGEYTIQDDGDEISLIYLSGDDAEGLSGTLVIVSHDTVENIVTGTFEFETADHIITEGQFTIYY